MRYEEAVCDNLTTVTDSPPPSTVWNVPRRYREVYNKLLDEHRSGVASYVLVLADKGLGLSAIDRADYVELVNLQLSQTHRIVRAAA